MNSTRETRRNAILWMVLVGVSAGSVASAASEAGVGITGMLLTAAAIKFALVGWQYMELRSAHLAWRLALGLFLTGFVGFAYWITAVEAVNGR